MNDDLTPELRRALDTFAVPPPAAGFADRATARLRARPAAALPRQRSWLRRSASPWARAGKVAVGVAAFGLMSATAAAMGLFGEPVRVPVISEIAQRLEIMPAPAAPAPPRALAAAADQAPDALADAPVASTVKDRLRALRDDPELRALPRPQRRAEVRQTAREMVESGEATPREVITAARELRREAFEEATPAQRWRMIQDARRRQQQLRRAIVEASPEQRAELRRRLEALRERSLASPPEALPLDEGVQPSEGSGEVLR